MKHLKKFDAFMEAADAAEPTTKPTTRPAEPTTKPGDPQTRPGRPSPVRRDRPAVEPDPMAKKKSDKKGPSKATAEAVANRFIELSEKEGFDFKKYFKK